MPANPHKMQRPYPGPLGVWRGRKVWTLAAGAVSVLGALLVAGVVIFAVSLDTPASGVWAAAVGALLVTFLLWTARQALHDTQRTIELTEEGVLDRRPDDTRAIGWALIRDVRLYAVVRRRNLDVPRMAVLDKAGHALLDWDRRRIARWPSLHRAIIAGIRLHHGGLPDEPDTGGEGISRQLGDTRRVRAALKRLRGPRTPDQVDVPGPNPLLVFVALVAALIVFFVMFRGLN